MPKDCKYQSTDRLHTPNLFPFPQSLEALDSFTDPAKAPLLAPHHQDHFNLASYVSRHRRSGPESWAPTDAGPRNRPHPSKGFKMIHCLQKIEVLEQSITSRVECSPQTKIHDLYLNTGRFSGQLLPPKADPHPQPGPGRRLAWSHQSVSLHRSLRTYPSRDTSKRH